MIPARPRHAASLVLIRQGRTGPEVLMGRRPGKSAFAPDVFVFPGGKLDPADRVIKPTRSLSEACIRLSAARPSLANALAVAALRETEEETGLTVTKTGVQDGPDLSSLTLIARAITPTESPIRFHARFFQMDASLTIGAHAATPELADLDYRPLASALKLPMFDITEAVLHHLADQNRTHPAFLYTYRGGKPRHRALA